MRVRRPPARLVVWLAPPCAACRSGDHWSCHAIASMNRCTCYNADPAYHASALRDAEACSRALTPAPDLPPDDVPLMALDLGPLKDRDLAILYCGVFIANVRGGRIAVGVRSKKAVDAALFAELERRGLTTLDAAHLAIGAAMTAN